VSATDNIDVSKKLIFLCFALAYFYTTAASISRDVLHENDDITSHAAKTELKEQSDYERIRKLTILCRIRINNQYMYRQETEREMSLVA